MSQAEQLQQELTKMGELFAEMDFDGSGGISLEEMERLMKAYSQGAEAGRRKLQVRSTLRDVHESFYIPCAETFSLSSAASASVMA